MSAARDAAGILASAVATVIASFGYDVSVRVYEHVADDWDQPDPFIDEWREASDPPALLDSTGTR